MSERVAANSLWFMNGHVTVHLSHEDNADGISITEHLLPAGFGPPFHIHHDEDETFYVLEGEFRFKLGDAISHARIGETVHLPKGIPHGFRVISASGGRVLIIARGGFEEMLRNASVPATLVTLPEQGAPTPEMQASLGAICVANGIDFLGPPID